jgi:predicted RND superfamily exporter protein
MWGNLARFILKNRLILLIALMLATVFMAYHASHVKLSYEFSRAIPRDNPKYQTYQSFRQKFGEDGNLLVVGVQTDDFFKAPFFNGYSELGETMKNIPAVENVLSIPTATNLVKDSAAEKLLPSVIFRKGEIPQSELDSNAALFMSLPFYRGLLYNPEAKTYLMGLSIRKDVMNSKERNEVVAAIVKAGDEFGKKYNVEMHYSGLPHIRTNMATKVADEMQWFLLGSILLSAVILLIFFRSFSATLLSLGVVIIGVIWSLGTIEFLGYKITLLTALIPPLVVVIGIPNCIYFLNKYHTSFLDTGEKKKALVEMITRMGVVTLFCNIAAAIGFAVFALTKSEILKEFGVVAGFNIMALFFISIIIIPVFLSYLPVPKRRHTKYLQNKWLSLVLDRLELWCLHHKGLVYGVTVAVIVVSFVGIFRLRSEGFIVDDLPKTDKIYTDLKFFEKNFRGVMPLEILIDTKRKNGLRSKPLETFAKIDSLSQFIASQPEMAKPISIVEGMKFARQAYYDGDSSNYGLPNSFDISFLAQYLGTRNEDSTAKQSNFSRIVNSFMDSNRQQARISVNMADVGSKRLPELLDTISQRSSQLFDTARYKVLFTGTSVTFLEGSAFIINGLKESVIWAFLLIALCMLYLFRSFKILICSLIPNIIPLIITAGIMGWVGVALKPSTVLVFSVALGISIDITIRFLVNYKQELQRSNKPASEIVIETIHKTGISIIYTSLVLIAGFVIFCFSGFGGTKALGWLTSLTLVLATLTNLVFLPVLLLGIGKVKDREKSMPSVTIPGE